MIDNVSASSVEAKPDPFADLAAELRRVADDLSDLIGSGLPVPSHVALDIHAGTRELKRDDTETANAVDTLGRVLLGKPGRLQKMHDDSYHYGTEQTARGPIKVHVYDSVSTPWAVKHEASSALAEKEAELAKLRAEVEELRASQGFGPEDYQRFFPGRDAQPADPTGLNFSREADDPTPVSPARVPLHEGAIVDGDQLVDETPRHGVAGGWTGEGHSGVECKCGVTYDGFDTYGEALKQLDQHIAAAAQR